MKAVVRGDFHASKRDSRALFDRDCTEIDVLYIEGRGDKVDFEGRGAFFDLFVMGYLSLELLYSFVGWIYQYLPGDIDIKQQARSNGWHVKSDIDAEIHEVYDATTKPIARRLFVLVIMLVVFAFAGAATGGRTLGMPVGVISTLLVLLLPFAYFAFLIILGIDTPNYRDKRMVDAVVDDATSTGVDSVILFVGDHHVPVVADLLEQEGWDVSRERSAHSIPRISRALSRLTGTPIGKVRGWVQDTGRLF